MADIQEARDPAHSLILHCNSKILKQDPGQPQKFLTNRRTIALGPAMAAIAFTPVALGNFVIPSPAPDTSKILTY
jgi:hypothetical protein